jgi:hypothetical protein
MPNLPTPLDSESVPSPCPPGAEEAFAAPLFPTTAFHPFSAPRLRVSCVPTRNGNFQEAIQTAEECAAAAKHIGEVARKAGLRFG